MFTGEKINIRDYYNTRLTLEESLSRLLIFSELTDIEINYTEDKEELVIYVKEYTTGKVGSWEESLLVESYRTSIVTLIRNLKEIKVFLYGASKIIGYVNEGLMVYTKESQLDNVLNRDGAMIVICGVKREEFKSIKEHLKSHKKQTIIGDTSLGVIVDTCKQGKVYMGGNKEFTDDTLSYGYKLRDEINVADKFKLYWATSKMWAELAEKEHIVKKVAMMIINEEQQVKYIRHQLSSKALKEVSREIYQNFLEVYGDKVYPICELREGKLVDIGVAGKKLISVSYEIKEMLKTVEEVVELEKEIHKDIKIKVESLTDKVDSKIDKIELGELKELIKLL